MTRIARVVFGAGAALAAASLGAHLLTRGNPVADRVTMWLFVAGFVTGAAAALVLDGSASRRKAGQ